MKVLEAMALGTLVVSTSKGAEGLRVTHGRDILIADDPREFVESIVRLLNDSGLRESLANNGRQLVEQRYNWQPIGAKMNTLIESVARRQHAPDVWRETTSL